MNSSGIDTGQRDNVFNNMVELTDYDGSDQNRLPQSSFDQIDSGFVDAQNQPGPALGPNETSESDPRFNGYLQRVRQDSTSFNYVPRGLNQGSEELSVQHIERNEQYIGSEDFEEYQIGSGNSRQENVPSIDYGLNAAVLDFPKDQDPNSYYKLTLGHDPPTEILNDRQFQSAAGTSAGLSLDNNRNPSQGYITIKNKLNKAGGAPAPRQQMPAEDDAFSFDQNRP